MMRRTVARLALALAFIAAAAHAQTLRDDIIDAATVRSADSVLCWIV
jgi:hypothetical protein